ncbi:MAG: DUF1801 domain-containing protein [Chloroflexi bacterium]|nr:DUF1801 domain-containing protein [Chloroflexota bacterium]
MTSKKAKKDAENLAAVLAKIPNMFGAEAALGMRLHEIIMSAAPELKPRLWYGMPGYAKDGPVLVFIRKDDYLTFGITEKANIQLAADAADQLMPNAWFLNDLDAATEARIAAIVRSAVA